MALNVDVRTAMRVGLPLAATLALLPATALPMGVEGTWLTEGGKSQVRIEACRDGGLLGHIVWLREPLDEDGAAKRDRRNADPALRERPIVGLALLQGFRPSGDDGEKWEDGMIYNPEDGETYHATLRLDGESRLRVRGYVGLPLFGRSQTWTRADEPADTATTLEQDDDCR